jgi:hypothetical protein
MSVLARAAAGFDGLVDLGRWALGLPPLPPVLERLTFDQPPTVRIPNWLYAETSRTIYSYLRVEQGQYILFEGAVPRDGRVGITPLTAELIRVHLKLESRHAGTGRHGSIVTEAIFEPLANGPTVERFDVPAKVRLGDDLACAWHAPQAAGVCLAGIEDGNIADHIGPPIGQILLHPTRPGRLMVRLTAQSEWGQTTLTRTVEVVAPKLRLRLLRPAVQAAQPGEEVRFEWTAEGACSVWLISPGCDRPQLLREEKEGGLLCVTLGWRPMEFQLIARGYGGAERSVTLTAVPQPFACLAEPH